MQFFTSLNKRRWFVASVTLVLAFFSGHVMQHVLAKGAVETEVILASADAVIPVAPRATRVQLAAPPIMADRVSATAAQAEDISCRPQLNVATAPAATLHVEVTAPCHRQVRTHITQGKVTASIATDGEGSLRLRLPAFSTEPKIEVSIAGVTLVAYADVPEADSYEHIALQWSGAQALGINAYEFGAQKSQFGHVWAGSPKSPARASRGSGGFLTRLGDGLGKSAEIYSFPSGQASTRGVIRLVAEATVTDENCGRRITATALQTGRLAQLRPTQVAVTLPPCSQVGQTVRLQNLFQDMRLARR